MSRSANTCTPNPSKYRLFGLDIWLVSTRKRRETDREMFGFGLFRFKPTETDPLFRKKTKHRPRHFSVSVHNNTGCVPGDVCVFFKFNRSFYPSTSSTTSLRADSSILEDIKVLWSQSYATEILRCHVCSMHCSGPCKAMSLH